MLCCRYTHTSVEVIHKCTYVHSTHSQVFGVGADSVSADVLSSVSEQERKRQEAIFELLTSERNYVDSLKLVKEVFFDPMIQDQVLEEEDIAKVSC